MQPTRPEAEIAADLKARAGEAMRSVALLMDEAAQHGLVLQWDTFAAAPPFMRFSVQGLRVVKHY